jgi:hypothetical protein
LYEVAIAAHESKVVSINGPFPAATSDLTMERFHAEGPHSSILQTNPLGEPQGSNWLHASVEASQRVSSQPLSTIRGDPLSHDALGLQY